MRWYLAGLSIVLLVLGLIFPALSLAMAGTGSTLETGIARLEELTRQAQDWYDQTDSVSAGAGGGADAMQPATQAETLAVRARLETLGATIDQLRASLLLAQEAESRSKRGLQALAIAMAVVAVGAAFMLWLITVRRIVQPLRSFYRLLESGTSEGGSLPRRSLLEISRVFRAYQYARTRLGEYREKMLEAERSNLSRFVVHEVRNALTPIHLGLRMLQDSPGLGPAESRVLLSMNSALKPLGQTLEQLRMLYSSGSPRLETVDLDAFLRELVASYANSPVPCELESQADPAGEIPVLADLLRLSMAVHNIVRNAQEACEESGGGIRIQIEQLDSAVAVEVRDTGPGMSEETLSRLFTEYFSTKRQGTGLGLVFARRMLEAQGMKLTVASTLGSGTCCTIHIPRREHSG